MKKLIFIPLTIFNIIFLSSYTEKSYSCNEKDYLITKIDSINNWYVILAKRNDSVFKIVSRNHEKKCCERISVNRQYKLLLQKRMENVLSPNGLKLIPMNYLDIQNINYNPDTDIVLPNEEGIFGLYTCTNLTGLCFHE